MPLAGVQGWKLWKEIIGQCVTETQPELIGRCLSGGGGGSLTPHGANGRMHVMRSFKSGEQNGGMLAVFLPNCAHRWADGRGRADRLRHLTFDALDLTGSEASEGALVLGSRDSSWPHGTLNVDNWSSSRGPTLPEGNTLSGHLGGVCRSQLGGRNSRKELKDCSALRGTGRWRESSEEDGKVYPRPARQR